MKFTDALINSKIETPSLSREGLPIIPSKYTFKKYYPSYVIYDDILSESYDKVKSNTTDYLRFKRYVNQRLRGCDFLESNFSKKTCVEVENNLHNDARKTLYNIYKLYNYYLYLGFGLKNWGYFTGDLNADWGNSNAFGASNLFSALRVSSKKLVCTITTIHPCHLPEDGGPRSTIVQPGDIAFDGKHEALILDIEHISTTQFYLYLNKDVFPETYDNKVRVGYQHYPNAFRKIVLDYLPVHCEYDKHTNLKCFSSFKSIYPTAIKSSCINGEYYCSKFSSNYQGANCNNTQCEFYKKNFPTCHSWDLSHFMAARGIYNRYAIRDSLLQNLCGIENFTGIYELIGLPTRYRIEGLISDNKDFVNHGKLKCKTGNKTDDYFDEFISFYEKENADDSFGFLDGWHQYPKVSPSGKTIYDMKETSSTWEKQNYLRSPAWDNLPHQDRESTILNVYGKDVNQKLLSSGNGYLQSPVHFQYVSKTFFSGKDSACIDEFTKLTSYATPQIYKDYSYKQLWELPAYCQSIWQRYDIETKSIVGGWGNDLMNNEKLLPTISKSTLTGNNILRLEFELSWDMAEYVKNPEDLQNSICYYKSGGFICLPENLSYQSQNPKTRMLMGDRQVELYPGDSVEFTDFEGRIQCIKVSAFSGETDLTAEDIPSTVPMIPQWLRDNHKKRDVAWFDLSGCNSDIIYSAQNNQLVGKTLKNVTRENISPPVLTPEGTQTGFFPELYIYDNYGLRKLLDSEFMWDAAKGIVLLSLPNSIYETQLIFSGWVYNRIVGYPVETIKALSNWINGIKERGYINFNCTVGGSSFGERWFINTDEYDSCRYYPANLLADPPEGSEPYTRSWTTSDCKQYPTPFIEATKHDFGTLSSPLSKYTTGVISYDGNLDVPQLLYTNYCKVVEIDLTATPLSRCCFDDIYKIYFDVRFSEASMNGFSISYRSNDLYRDTYSSWESESFPDCSFSLVYTDDDCLTFTMVSTLTNKKALIKKDNDFVGTIDATNCCKYIIQHDQPGRRWGIRVDVATSGNWFTHQGSFTYRDYDNLYYDWYDCTGKSFSYNDFSVENCWISFNPQLSNAPDFLPGNDYLYERFENLL